MPIISENCIKGTVFVSRKVRTEFINFIKIDFSKYRIQNKLSQDGNQATRIILPDFRFSQL